MNVIIHLGMHKTGTSFLQKEVFPKLEGVNYLYKPYKIWDLILKENKINLISGEAFSHSMPHNCLNQANTLKLLKKLFPNAKIILGVRDEDTWLRSCYSEYIKTGGRKSFKKYKELKYDISGYVNKVEGLWDNVFIYHQEKLNQELSSMCNFIGVEMPILGKVTKVNKSFTTTQLKLWRVINIFPFPYIRCLWLKKIRGEFI
jgi:hypothetical protein